MPEYDAFGREIGDDPLAAFREPVKPKPAAEPAVAPPEAIVAPPEPAAPRLEFVRPRRRRGRGLAGLIVIVAVLGAAGLVVGAVGMKVEGGIDDIVGSLPTAEPPAQPVTGITGDSLIRHANFAKAVATLSNAGLGRPLTMRVAPDRIDATLIAKGGRLHQVQIAPGGELRELASGDGAPGRTLAYKAIDTAAPERLVRAGATKKVPARRIDYLVVSAGPPVGWGAYYKGGRIVFGDAHGRKQRVL